MELLGKSRAELAAVLTAWGEPPYRAAQLYEALYAQRRFELGAITNLPAKLRERLGQECTVTLPRIVRRYDATDGTIRYVFEMKGEGAAGVERGAAISAGTERGAASSAPTGTVETVFMPEESRQTICISTQAGCAVDCRFCLTATLGLIRNLTAGEMVGQVLLALEENRAALKPQTNVVLMGQGEPLLNYEPVFAALRILLDPAGVGLSPKHVTLSTSGIIPGIERMGREEVRPKLAISLNASNDAQRNEIMPVNRKYPIAELLAACRAYPLRSWEHITFEYVLLGGFNDAPDDARRLVRLLGNLRCKVNLIPWNPGELPYHPPSPERTEAMRQILTEKGIPAFVRYSRGQEIMAACGQLALVEIHGAASG